MVHFAFQNGAFCVPKRCVLHSKMVRFAFQNGAFCKTTRKDASLTKVNLPHKAYTDLTCIEKRILKKKSKNICRFENKYIPLHRI